MRVFALSTIDKPSEIVALKMTAPVFVLKMVYRMRSNHEAIVFPEAHHALGREACILTVGDDVIVIGEVDFEELDEAFFAFVGFGCLEGFVNSSHGIGVLVVVNDLRFLSSKTR